MRTLRTSREWTCVLFKAGGLTVRDRKYFPPTATEEKAEENAEEDAAEKSTDETELAAKLPDAPTAEPKDPEEPSQKKQRTEMAEDDFVVVDKEDAKEAKDDAPKADL